MFNDRLHLYWPISRDSHNHMTIQYPKFGPTLELLFVNKEVNSTFSDDLSQTDDIVQWGRGFLTFSSWVTHTTLTKKTQSLCPVRHQASASQSCTKTGSELLSQNARCSSLQRSDGEKEKEARQPKGSTCIRKDLLRQTGKMSVCDELDKIG